MSKLAPSRPASASSNSLNLGRQLHLQPRSITASKCISKFAPSRPPSASQNSLYHGLQVHLWVHSISASKCISKLARSRPQSAFLSSLDLGVQVHLSTHSITASKYIVNERWRVFSDTGVTEVDWATGSSYSGHPGVDRHHLIFISSRSAQLRGFSWPGSIISSHFLPRLLELERFFLTNSVVLSMGVFMSSSDYARLPSVARLTICIYIEILK